MTYIPYKRHLVAQLFFGEEIQKARQESSPASNDSRWNKKHPKFNKTFLCWVKSNNEIKLAFYFPKEPHWYEVKEVKLIENVIEFIEISP